MNLDDIITAIIMIVGFYTLFYAGKFVNQLLHREYNLIRELVQEDNPALALGIGGYYLGLVLSIGGAIEGPSRGITADLIDLCIYGVLSIILMNLSWFVCDKLILHKFKITDELIRDQNEGAGAVLFGVCVGSGLVIFGSVSGDGGTIWTAVVFWFIGQVMLIIAALIYNIITCYDIHDEIEKDNVAAGISFAGVLIATGMLVGTAAKADFESWSVLFSEFIPVALFGLILLPLIRLLTDKILLPTVKLSDEIAQQEKPNMGAAYIEALSYISSAFVICWCI